MRHRRGWRSIAAVCALSLTCLTPLVVTHHLDLPLWNLAFHQGSCIGPCCVIDNGFFELSCGEYSPASWSPSNTQTSSTSAGSP